MSTNTGETPAPETAAEGVRDAATAGPVMRLRIEAFGAPDVLRVVKDAVVPMPSAGEVGIRVEASSLVFTDMLIRRNLYPSLKLTLPLTLGYDVIGHVYAVGAGVTRWRIGDRVADLTQIGGNATHLVRPADTLVAVPPGIDATRAEPMILSYLTASQVLFREAEARQNDPVLVYGASGAVGLAALDLCRAFGLPAVGVASARREETVTQYGATFVAYDGANMSGELDRLAREVGGFKVIVDAARGEALSRVRRRLASDGRLVVTGFTGPFRSAYPVANSRPSLSARIRFGLDFLRVKRLTSGSGSRVSFYDISGRRKQHPDWFQSDLTALFALLEEGRIEPRIQHVFGLDEAVEAHRLIEAAQVEGRLVLDLTTPIDDSSRGPVHG